MLLYSVLAAAAVPLARGEDSRRSLAALGDDSTQTEYSYDYTDAPTASPTCGGEWCEGSGVSGGTGPQSVHTELPECTPVGPTLSPTGPVP